MKTTAIESAKRTADNSPAIYCWEWRLLPPPKPVKRATEIPEAPNELNTLSSASRTYVHKMASVPSDESLGYSQTSASRTELTEDFVHE